MRPECGHWFSGNARLQRSSRLLKEDALAPIILFGETPLVTPTRQLVSSRWPRHTDLTRSAPVWNGKGSPTRATASTTINPEQRGFPLHRLTRSDSALCRSQHVVMPTMFLEFPRLSQRIDHEA